MVAKPHSPFTLREPIVVTGIGMLSSLGLDRETTWRAVCRGESGVRWLRGVAGIPDDSIVAAPVEISSPRPGELKAITLAFAAAEEALADARVDFSRVERERFGCAISGQMGDLSWLAERLGLAAPRSPDAPAWWSQWLPNSGCAQVASHFGLWGPRLCHSTACASGLCDILAAVRAIADDQCDIVLAGSAEAIHPLFVAGFSAMRVLARHEDPRQACRPFDAARSGFVMGEGAAMFVVERLGHALARGASIYAEIAGGRMLSEAHHVTGLEGDGLSLARLISETLRQAGLAPDELDYVNAHGTGTQQNDPLETRGIRLALGRAADRICMSSTKAMLGHLVNAAGSVELAISALALRDGFVPPTLNLTDPDPECDLDCIPLVGRRRECQTALKLSVAFGGHLAAVALRRWPGAVAIANPPARIAA